MVPIREALEKHRDKLMALEGVVAVAEGERGGNSCIKVYVLQGSLASLSKIPSHLDGFSVVVETVDSFKARRI